MNSKLNIWLADLFHNKVSPLDVVPINLGYLASALQQIHNEAVALRLFKYPDKLIKELKNYQPDILALSNYTWNIQLSLYFARFVKERYPEVIVLMGGPNIRIDKKGIYDFLKKYPYVDVYIPLEAESPFCALVGQLIKNGKPSSIDELYRKSGEIPGCYLSIENYDFNFMEIKRNHSLFSSPYLKGILDEFIRDPFLVPIFETNRGCPYGCTFCTWGISVRNELRVREIEEVIEDFNYVAENCAGQDLWFFADANFGILKRDLQLAAELKKIKQAFGYPKRLNINWSKNSGKRILEIMTILKGMVSTQIAVQSFDEQVLKRIKRKNLDDRMIQELTGELHLQGCNISTDILVGCSGETLKSHLETLRTAFELVFDNLNINNVRMLCGAQIETDGEREEYNFMTKYRFIPNSYGIYDSKFVFEIEEAIKASNTMSEAEMNWLKKIHFLVYLLWNSGFAKYLLSLSLKSDLNPLDVILMLGEDEEDKLYQKVLAPLAAEYELEWFPNEEVLRKHYARPEVYRPILEGKTSSEKLMWKYMAYCLCEKDLIHNALNKVSQLIREHTDVDKELLEVVKRISIDRLKLDVTTDADLNKNIWYELKEENYKRLKQWEIIPANTFFDGRGFTISYEYKHEDYQSLHKILERFNYEKQPITALCAALGNDMLAHFTYALKDSVI